MSPFDPALFDKLKLFHEPEHRPFHWAGESTHGVVLLVHGFPGTPAEMRPLAQVLHQRGWATEAILLPGFGPRIAQLMTHQVDDWHAALQQTLSRLQTRYGTVLLMGYSLGAALALQVATQARPQGLILLAPFQELMPHWFHRLIWHALKPIYPYWRPLRKADFSEPRLRAGLSSFLSGADIDDPALQTLLRQLPVPVKIIEEIRRAGHCGRRCAVDVTIPTLVVQGTDDEIVRPNLTRQLLASFGGPVQYHEVQGNHDLVKADHPAFQEVAQAICHFAERFTLAGTRASASQAAHNLPHPLTPRRSYVS